jgi:predicted DsbA family dithiol-disulfide isomerase
MLICPICGSTYHRLGHLLRHAKRKHHIDLSNSNQSNTFDMLPTSNIERNNSNEQIDTMNSNGKQSK